MTRNSVLVFLAVSALSATPTYGAQAQQPSSAATSPTIVYDHQKENGQPMIYTREWDNGQAFEVQILNTCPGSFDYEIKGIRAAQSGNAKVTTTTRTGFAPEQVEQLSTKTLTGKHESKYGGYFVIITPRDPPPKVKCEVDLPNTTLVIQVTTPGWDIAFAGGFVGSGLTDPVYSLAPNPTPNATTKIVTETPDQKDKVKLGLAAFVFVSKKQWKVIPLAFGIGVDSTNRTTYYFGPGIPLGDKAVLTGGVAIGNVSRLPNGMKPGDAVSADTKLENLPTQTVVRWFFGISYSFIDTRDKLTKPFAGSS